MEDVVFIDARVAVAAEKVIARAAVQNVIAHAAVKVVAAIGCGQGV